MITEEIAYNMDCCEYDTVTTALDRRYAKDNDAVTNWMIANGFDMTVRVIDIDDAVGSGYIRDYETWT